MKHLILFIGYRLVIVCSNEGEDMPHIVSKLFLHKRSMILKHNDRKYQSYLRNYFIQSGDLIQAAANASIVDHEKCINLL